MDSKFFDIPFRSPSLDSDFICKDGELASAENITLLQNDGTILESSDLHRNIFSETEKPPIPDIDFALLRTTLPGWHIHPDMYPSKTVAGAEISMEYWNSMAAQLLRRFLSEALFNNLFVSPFYVMGAWKSVNGDYLSVSEPQILIPNTKVPPVAANSDLKSEEIDFKIAAAVCSLCFKMKVPEILRDWINKIECLEILVSHPIFTYDTITSFLPFRNYITDNSCESLDLSTGKVSRQLVCSETLPLAWEGNIKGRDLENLSGSIIRSSLKFTPLAQIPLSCVDLAYDWTSLKNSNEIARLVYGSLDSMDYSFISEGPEEGKIKSAPVIIQGKNELINILTRPIKLNQAGKLKRMSRIFLRGDYNRSSLTITLESSRDMSEWWPVARRKGGVLPFPYSPFKFIRIGITGLLKNDENLQGLSITRHT